MKFNELNINEKILRATNEMGFEEASPIQAQAIPPILEGKDIIGQAQTGTGKTAAFGIPLLECIDTKDKNVQAIILCPTRELAIQVADEMRKLTQFMHGVKILPLYGGQEIVRQIKALKLGVQIVIGTPGRVMDHMRRKTVKFDKIKMLVLDEADEMLNMGFREDIETILQGTPTERQTILFSATMPNAIKEIAKNYQRNAVTVKVVHKELTVSNIEQYYYEVRPQKKDEVLTRLIDATNPKLSIIFCNTKHKVDELVTTLKGLGYFADGLHGDLKQSQRDRVMVGFRSGKTEILVATDVAARGIDVENIDAVFNYDLPQDEEYYVHRIGRTGRAGKTGTAYSFVVGKEIYKLKEISRYCKATIKAMPIPSLNDIKNTKIEKLFEAINNIITENGLDDMRRIIEDQSNSSDVTAIDIAAAFLKMNMGDLDKPEKEESITRTFEKTGAQAGMVRLFINIGKKQRVRPGDIVGAIAGESGIAGSLIGAIDMFDGYTFVEVPIENAQDVITAMKKAKIKGKPICVEPANSK